MSYSKFAAAALVVGAALVQSSPAEAAIIGAHSGKAFFSNQTNCFTFDNEFYSRVRFTGGTGCGIVTGGWWAVPVPISSTGNKTFSVYYKDTSSAPDSCWAHVFTQDGDIQRSDEVTFLNEQGWKPFEQLLVSTNEHVDIECFIGNVGTGAPNTWMSAVKGF